jgi:hypothetical protein
MRIRLPSFLRHEVGASAKNAEIPLDVSFIFLRPSRGTKYTP